MIPLKRTYKTSDGGLVEITQRMLTGANRDILKLNDYAYTQAMLDAIDAKKIAFAGLPTDVELSSMIVEATKAKNDKRTAATEYVMTEVMARVKLKYVDEQNAVYKRFGVSNIYNETDGNFLILLYRVHRQANALQPTLGQGLTVAIVAQVETLAGEFLALWKAQDAAIDDRDVAVQTRVEAGNSLYEDVAKLGELGKRIWLNKDESKYNDYVIYPSGAEPPSQSVVESDVNPGEVVSLSVTGVEANSVSDYVNTGTTDIQLYYSTAPAVPPMPGEIIITVGGGSHWHGEANDSGFVAGTREYLNARNVGGMIGHVKVTIYH